jgi:Zn-dependent protease
MRSWKIGSAFGIPIYFHWSFLILPLLVLGNLIWQQVRDPRLYVLALAIVPAVFACLVLHELGHALAARAFGIGTRDITMYPIGGVARLERMSEKPLEELCIAIAGPAVNVVIALLLMMVAVPLLALAPGVLQTLPGQFLTFLLAANVVLVIFNMLPAFPMDGGRVFRALLAIFLGHLQATRVAVGVAAVMALLMGLVGLGVFHDRLGPLFDRNLVLILVAGFVFLLGQRELQMVERKEKLRNEEPLMVLPVFRPRPVYQPPLDLQPSITVYTWDAVNGIWVKDGAAPPPRTIF